MPLYEAIDGIELVAQELPRNIRASLSEFKSLELDHAICVKDPRFPHELVPQTPKAYRPPGQIEMVNFIDICHLLFARMLGQFFGWTSIQDGYILNDIMPLPERRDTVSSSGSAVTFDLHTEDAFHPCAGDYLGLACLRNPGEVGTAVAIIPFDELSAESVAILFQSRFIVGANLAQQVSEVTQPSPIFWGMRIRPFFRININSTLAVKGDEDAMRALNELINCLRLNTIPVALQPGEYWYFDNYRLAHGRGPFTPSYDGKDRWLRRLYISSCFRRSAQYRTDLTSYVLDPRGL